MASGPKSKLDEVTYFLQRMEECYQNDNHFQWNLSAFLCALRSVPHYLEVEYGSHTGFKEWFKDLVEGLKEDKELVFIKNVRDNNIHTRSVRTGAQKGARVANIVNPIKEGEESHRKQKPMSATDVPTGRCNTTYERFFPEYPNIEIITFCKRQFDKVKAFVDDCEDRFAGH